MESHRCQTDLYRCNLVSRRYNAICRRYDLIPGWVEPVPLLCPYRASVSGRTSVPASERICTK